MKENPFAFVAKKFDLLETIFAVLYAASLTIMMTEIKFASEAVLISSLLLAFLYWIMSMQTKIKKETGLLLISTKVTWISLAVAVLGILMKIRIEEKADLLLLSGIALLFVSIFLNFYYFTKTRTPFKFATIIRAFIFLIISLFLYSL